MQQKIRVGAVSYLNTKPLLWGLGNSEIKNKIDLTLDYPSRLAKAMKEGTLDVALMPVAAMKDLAEPHITGSYCIAAEGNVQSVAIFSYVPMQEIKTVYLDYQSRTSVRLAEILLERFWKVQVEYVPASENYIELIKGNTAGVIIGDRALQQLNNYPYVYDLSKAWKDMTGYDFVFAAWIANKLLSSDFVHSFDKAMALGLANLDTVIRENQTSYYDIRTYYTENIVYQFDASKRSGLELFMSMLQ